MLMQVIYTLAIIPCIVTWQHNENNNKQHTGNMLFVLPKQQILNSNIGGRYKYFIGEMFSY